MGENILTTILRKHSYKVKIEMKEKIESGLWDNIMHSVALKNDLIKEIKYEKENND